MGRLSYSLPEDVIRLTFGGTGHAGEDDIAEAIDRNQVIGTEDDRAYLTTLLDRAESRWDREATPMKPVPVGSDTVPKFYSASGKPWPVNIYLDHMNVHPIDANMGDFVELRTGRGTDSEDYNDVTDQEGSAWAADYDKGVLTVYRVPGAGHLPAFERVRDRFLRISYHVSAGGDFSSAGQTTLAEDITDTDTGSVSVSSADRLPESGETVLLGGTEYAYMSGADHDADTVTLDTRGVDFTNAASHSEGDEIGFVPPDVRDAVGLIAAIRLLDGENFTEALFDGDFDRTDKMERWDAEVNDTIAEYSVQGGTA